MLETVLNININQRDYYKAKWRKFINNNKNDKKFWFGATPRRKHPNHHRNYKTSD